MDDADTKENIPARMCNPAKQGPRPLSRNQGRVYKSLTGQSRMKETTILSQGHAKTAANAQQAQNGHMEYPQYAAAWKISTIRWRHYEIGSWYNMWVAGGEMGWTRTFQNTGWPHSSIIRSTYSGYIMEWQSGFIGKSMERLSDINQSATEFLLRDFTWNHEPLLWFKCMANDSSHGWRNGEVIPRFVSSS